MPVLFSYGTLHQEDVQLSTFGRLLQGRKDELPAFEPSLVKIEDPRVAASSGRTHHDNVTFNGRSDSRVSGTAFEISDAELVAADRYEALAAYERTAVVLASGQQAWVYVDARSAVHVRRAVREDLEAIVRMLADDALGVRREAYSIPLPASYERAFEAIEADANNELAVACFGDIVVGVLQLTFIPCLTYQGGWRALVEGVRVDSRRRGRGIGRILIQWAISRARERRCHVIQLTTDKSRVEARSFYESLGFMATHEGMKLHL